MSKLRGTKVASGIVAAAAVLLAIPFESPRACSCVPTTKAAERERASAVFLCEVRSFRALPSGGCDRAPEAHGRVARVRVIRSWKGVRAGTDVTVTTGMNSADCGFEFQTGRTYMVYAFTPEGDRALSTNLCTTTREVTGTAADPDTLGPPLD